MKQKMKIIKYLFFIVLIVFIDQITKYLLIDKNICIIPNVLDFTYTENLGAAFGMGTSLLVKIISLTITGVLSIYVVLNYKKIKFYLPFILIISGSIGNLIDRFVRGYVIDFIDVNLFNFPNFNIADICIVTGTFILAIYLLISNDLIKIKKKEKEEKIND